MKTEFAIESIHVNPFQGEALTNPQPKANADQRYRAEWVSQPTGEPLELVNRETAGLPYAWKSFSPLPAKSDSLVPRQAHSTLHSQKESHRESSTMP
jgi:hypothetical protein